MRAAGVFIAVIGALIFITRAPGIIVPRAYRRFVLDLFDNYPWLLKWLGRFLLLVAALFAVVTYVNHSQLDGLSLIVAICLQVALFTGGMFLQFPSAAKEIASSFMPEEAEVIRLILFLATALGGFICAYGVSMIIEP